jgi:hypothetical protein
MNIDDIIFDSYVICPLCKKKMKSINSAHLKYKHDYSNLKEFKIEFAIPMGVALVARDVRATMQKHGKRRSKWFKENVMPIGIEYAKTYYDLVPKEIRKHSGVIRRGRSWIPNYISEMKKQGWLDLHDAAITLGVSYNYARKCATDGRLKSSMSKGIRFTKPEWVKETSVLLQANREKYRPDLFKK